MPLTDPVARKEYNASYRANHLEELRKKDQDYYQDHKAEIIDAVKARYQADPESEKQRVLQWRRENRDKVRGYHIKMKYDITLEEVDAMLIAQSGRCGICGNPMMGKLEPCIDHDHETNRVRGLLCSLCNKSLGGFRDSIELLGKAIEYLKGLVS